MVLQTGSGVAAVVENVTRSGQHTSIGHQYSFNGTAMQGNATGNLGAEDEESVKHAVLIFYAVLVKTLPPPPGQAYARMMYE